MVEDDIYDLTQMNFELAVANLGDAEEEFEEAMKEIKKILEEGHWIL